MPNIALLDKDLRLTGFEIVDQPEAPSTYRIPVPRGCDLKPGKYAWDATAKAFVPIFPPEPEVQVTQPRNVVRAIARGFMAIRDGKPLPKDTLNWLTEFAGSVDNIG